VKDAICLLYKGDAKVVDTNYTTYTLDQWNTYSADKEGKKLSSQHYSILPPVVIYLFECDSQHSELRKVKYSRKNIFERDNHSCQYCNRKLSQSTYTIDHIIPKCLGGKDTFKNIVLACKDCNARKGGRTPEQSGMKLIAQPKEPKWRSFTSSPFAKDKKAEWEMFLLGR
jgi:hypothetical protein